MFVDLRYPQICPGPINMWITRLIPLLPSRWRPPLPHRTRRKWRRTWTEGKENAFGFCLRLSSQGKGEAGNPVSDKCFRRIPTSSECNDDAGSALSIVHVKATSK